jgi:hypothetical protein
LPAGKDRQQRLSAMIASKDFRQRSPAKWLVQITIKVTDRGVHVAGAIHPQPAKSAG